MTSSAFWAYGSKLQIDDGAGNYSDIAEITELAGPKMSKDSIEVTSHASASGYREFIAGMRDGGEVSFKANWLPTNTTHDGTTGLLESFNDDVNHNWKIILPNTLITITLVGHLTAFEPDLPLEEQGQLSGTIKVSGKPTVA